uniref:Membrane-associated guanylate kinase, WW and PDZ domain-containing protein 1-like n=1 Tax=Kryptolebias marmoratus TaxID=37003 RepID=A0A3Q2ZX02_KRYMA
MSKTAVKKLHWRSNVQDTFVPSLGASGELGISVGGGADYGEFPFITSAPGGSLTVGDIILEIGGTPVLGMTLGDVRGVLNSCLHPVRIKTVSPSTLCKDLRLYLSKCFTPGSVDSQLQQVIRENLYLRAVPTTRQPREGEISGVDYNFVSIEEFFSLEESGALLESGKFKNYYGTPRPVHISAESPPITYQEHRNLLRNFRTRSKSLSNLEKAADEGINSEDDSGLSFTDQPEDLRGFPVHTHLIKGSRGFGFNIVGGSRPREFLQVYSVTASGPSALKTDILVYINNVCVLGVSHKEVVEMLKSVPVGRSVDIEVRRGYPMLFNPDGRPKQPSPGLLDSEDHVLPPTTVQPQPLHKLPRLPTTTPHTRHFNGLHSDGDYTQPGVTLDANGNATSFASRPPPPYRRSSVSNAAMSSPVLPPRFLKSLARLQSLDPTLASQSDSEVVSAIGSHASMIRNHNNNSLSTPPHLLRYGTSKSSESDLSTCTVPGSRLPLPESPRRPSSSPSGPRSAHSHLFRPHTSHLRPPSTSDSPHHRGFNGFHGNTSPTASPSSVSSPGAMSVGSGFGSFSGGELVPVALAQTEGERGLGFSLMAGGPGGSVTVVERVWDRKQCNSLQPGDAIVKINGADVQSLSYAQIKTILQEHTKQGEVILLVYRSGNYHSVSPGSFRRLPPPLLRPPPPPVGSDNSSVLPEVLPVPHTSTETPPSPAPRSSSLIQSTSFLESIPVTLTMEPKDWIDIGLEDEAGGVSVPNAGRENTRGKRTGHFRGFDVELRRKPGEGFGFVIASQDVENGKASLLPHRFVTVRRGSPAAKSGQIRAGDRLEAVEGQPVATLPHRELAQILRRAGNTLRLTIIPRPSTTADHDHSHRSKKGQRSRPKRDSRYYSVDLDRGPSGFGFSLRGGSEYNMGLYVLGLMEGGPASRSKKIQVSDQLVEINGDSTAGMTHSQAVEMIRRGGQRIHLVLKRGNGYVPDY